MVSREGGGVIETEALVAQRQCVLIVLFGGNTHHHTIDSALGLGVRVCAGDCRGQWASITVSMKKHVAIPSRDPAWGLRLGVLAPPR